MEDDSPAGRAGLEPGDLLVAAGGRDLSGIDSLYAALDEAGGESLSLSVVRGTDERTAEVSFEDDDGPVLARPRRARLLPDGAIEPRPRRWTPTRTRWWRWPSG